MSVADLFATLSAMGFSGAAIFGLGKWLWSKFERRMDSGDLLLLQRMDEAEAKRAREREQDKELWLGHDSRLSVLEKHVERHEGRSEAILAILTGRKDVAP